LSKSDIIKKACLSLNDNDKDKCKRIINEYPFEYIHAATRSYTKAKLITVFIRDGFVDRYSGEKLIFPGALMVLSKELPEEFPYHRNWKMSQCHIAWWQLFPTVDHIKPIARGGTNDYDNLVCTSMLRNSAKTNFTLEELGWRIYPAGNYSDWDGMTNWFMQYVDDNKYLLDSNYIKEWYRTAKSVLNSPKLIKEGDTFVDEFDRG